MKRALIALTSIVAIASLMYLFFLQQPQYGDVKLSREENQQLTEVKDSIDQLLTDVEKFKYTQKSFDKISQQADQLISLNTGHLDQSQLDQLQDLINRNPDSLMQVLKTAMDNNYQIDDEVGSQFFNIFEQIVAISATGIVSPTAQSNKIAGQLQKDLKIESRIIALGNAE